MARPTKRSPEREQAVLNALRLGNTRRNAAAYAEIDPATLWRWCEADATFRNAVEKAEADAETRFLGQVAKAAADGTWQAAAWWLERRRPEDYRRREGVELSGSNGGPIQTESIGAMNDHERRVLSDVIREELARRRAERSPAGGEPGAGEG